MKKINNLLKNGKKAILVGTLLTMMGGCKNHTCHHHEERDNELSRTEQLETVVLEKEYESPMKARALRYNLIVEFTKPIDVEEYNAGAWPLAWVESNKGFHFPVYKSIWDETEEGDTIIWEADVAQCRRNDFFSGLHKRLPHKTISRLYLNKSQKKFYQVK